MYKIILVPHKGVNIEGIGQVNFGDTIDQVIKTWGAFEDIRDGRRVRFLNYGFFADFKTTDGSFEAVEFWDDGHENVSEVFIYDKEVLKANAREILMMLQEKNNNEVASGGWFYNIDVIFCGGNPDAVLKIIEQYKQDGTYEENKKYLEEDLEKAKYFTSFGIGYKGYCKDGYESTQKILNSN
jgi:hypothetical protein